MARTLICCDLDRPDAVIDDIVAVCSGDMVGAVKALLLVNEQLESELQQLYAAATYRSPTKRPAKILLQ
jgi:predicted lipase